MNYKQYNDYELLYMVQENDEFSKSILYEKYLPIIHKLANKYYEAYSNYGYDYEDFFQEAIVAFYRASAVYDENKDSLFYTFLILCIKRSLLTFCRGITCSRKNLPNQYYVEINDFEVQDVNANIDVISDERLLQTFCLETILNLPIDYSSIFELSINGFSSKEIAVLMDLPRSTVAYRLRKARKYFSKNFEKYYCK